MPRTLLVADDVNANREILKKILGTEYEILEAVNGEGVMAVLHSAHQRISAVLLDLAMPVSDGFDVLRQMRSDAELSQIPVIIMTGNTHEASEVKALTLGANDYITKPYNPTIIRQRIRNTINLRETSAAVNALKKDTLTGLDNREAFLEKASNMIAAHEPGYYMLSSLDIDNFKVINDQYGTDKGDEVLRYVAGCIRDFAENADGTCCRVMADHFAMLARRGSLDHWNVESKHRETMEPGCIDRSINIRIGRYLVDDPSLPVSAMYDRASMAQSSIKGKYDVYVAQYDESMRARLLHDQQIVTDMNRALDAGEFEPWFQPQYNHATGALVGAEALVRWRRAQDGKLITPNEFIPVFERNGFIYKLDQSIWKQVCALLRKWIDAGRNPLPVSVNVSRYDLLCEDFFDAITSLVAHFKIPVELLRLEVTESAFSESDSQIVAVVRRLIDYGFTVEIDDFGSGYSSLNTLKDVPATVLKLDMRFLEGTGDTERGGNILESIVRMAKWLGMSVIAEGVETKEQADYLKSIGCFYVQGFLYARPMPVEEYETLASGSDKQREMIALETVENLDNNMFWNPASMDTLIFNSYVGGASIVEFRNGEIELLRVNDNYTRELFGTKRESLDTRELDLYTYMDAENKARLTEHILRAIETDAETTCECCLVGLQGEGARSYIRVAIRVIAKAGDRYLLYAAVLNMTAQREAEQQAIETAEQLSTVMSDMPGGFVRMRVLADGTIVPTYVNEGFCRLVGMSHDEVMRRYEKDALWGVHKDDLEPVCGMVAQMCETGSPCSMKYRLLHGDGSYIWVAVSGRMSRTDADDVYLSVYYTDASEEIRLENKQRELLDNLPCGAALYEYDGNGLTVKHINKRYQELVGRQIADTANVSVLAAVHPDDRDVIATELRDAVMHKRDAVCDIRIRCEGETYRPFHVVGRIVSRNNGRYSVYAAYTAIEESGLPVVETLPFLLAAIMESTTDLSFAKDLEFRYLSASNAFARMVGYESERDIIGKTDYDLFERETADKYRADDLMLLKEGKSIVDMLEAIPSDDGIQHYSSTSKYILRDQFGNIIGLYGVGRDVTEYRAAFEQLTLMTNSIPGGLAAYEVTPDSLRLTYYSDGYFACTGYTRDEYRKIAQNDPFALVLKEDMPIIRKAVRAVIAGEQAFGYEYRARRKDGSICWLSTQGVVVERHGNVALVNTVKLDITERKQVEEQLRINSELLRQREHERTVRELERTWRRQAETDGLTGILNRSATEERIRARLAHNAGTPCTLLIADIDNLKQINDTFGHPKGDEAVRLVAETIGNLFRQTDIVGRAGGDEFLVFLEGVNKPERVQDFLVALMDKLEKLRLGAEGELEVHVSIGATMGVTGEHTFEQLYRQADQALYNAKRNGKRQFAFYSPKPA